MSCEENCLLHVNGGFLGVDVLEEKHYRIEVLAELYKERSYASSPTSPHEGLQGHPCCWLKACSRV
ncbi:hypothetical protein HaLaN_13443 [Haematococcus lacustris]|uniref:Uncharacterized protein n=1 Tax=Haematococcus lacustris TaxID=44745 RepID=A0A699Z2X0_HAELA|nr:hypothetical protein HaLaN_13443 [Haematococcus lacustris]